MTLHKLMQGTHTIGKYDILMKADVMFADRCGRYYMGQLTSIQVEALSMGIEFRKE